MPCVDNCVRVDLRTVSFDVPPQEVLTKDSVTVSVDAVVYYRIKEPLNAVIKIANYRYKYFRYFFPFTHSRIRVLQRQREKEIFNPLHIIIHMKILNDGVTITAFSRVFFRR